MSISNYTELQTAIQTRLGGRTDLPVTDFIDLGEAYINRKLRVFKQEASASLTLTAGTNSIDLPADYKRIIDFRFTEDDHQPVQVSLEELNRRRSTATSRPLAFTISSSIQFEVTADQSYGMTLDYFSKWDIKANETNWLITNAPDVYLHASMVEAYRHIRNHELKGQSALDRMEAIDSLTDDDAETRGRELSRVDEALLGGRRFNMQRGY